jgi:hypothetical protein
MVTDPGGPAVNSIVVVPWPASILPLAIDHV